MAVAVDVSRVVGEALRVHKDRSEAADYLEQLAATDLELREALIAKYRPHVLHEICWAAVSSEAHVARSEVRRIVRSDSDFGPLGSRIQAAISRLDTWTLPLPGGPKLLTATREDLIGAIAAIKGQMAALRVDMNFYAHIAERLQPHQIVGEALTGQEIRDLLAQAESGR